MRGRPLILKTLLGLALVGQSGLGVEPGDSPADAGQTAQTSQSEPPAQTDAARPQEPPSAIPSAAAPAGSDLPLGYRGVDLNLLSAERRDRAETPTATLVVGVESELRLPAARPD